MNIKNHKLKRRIERKSKNPKWGFFVEIPNWQALQEILSWETLQEKVENMEKSQLWNVCMPKYKIKKIFFTEKKYPKRR